VVGHVKEGNKRVHVLTKPAELHSVIVHCS
jgi:hypothetical protein